MARIVIIGGHGQVALLLSNLLTQRGDEVSSVFRNPDHAEEVAATGAVPVVADIEQLDVDALAQLLAGHDAVVDLASALPSTYRFVVKSAWAQCHRIRSAGSATVVDAARAAAVPRVVQESVVMIYHDGADRWLDEDSAVDHYPNAFGNHAAEASAHRFAEAGGDAVILRFGLFYGPGAAHSEQIIGLARHHVAFQAGRPESYVSSIYLSDAANAVVAALGCASGNYNVVDDEPVTKTQHTQAMAAAVGARPWLIAPGRLALLLGDCTTSMTRSLRVSNARFRAATGWTPRYPSVREGYTATAASDHPRSC